MHLLYSVGPIYLYWYFCLKKFVCLFLLLILLFKPACIYKERFKPIGKIIYLALLFLLSGAIIFVIISSRWGYGAGFLCAFTTNFYNYS